VNAPDWLARRGGALQPGLNAQTVMDTLDGHPQYRLYAAPAEGKFTCAIYQTNNGKRLDAGKPYASADDALSGGLEELRGALGW
jgi:hypothetical protein